MKNFFKLTSILCITLLTTSFYFKAFALSGGEDCIELNAGAMSTLKGQSYRLYFFPLMPFQVCSFTSAKIEFSETDNTFSLTLFGMEDLEGITYLKCPYEASGNFLTLFDGHAPHDLEGAGFSINGITLGDYCLMGIFRFFLITNPPLECPHLFWGGIISSKLS